MLALFVNTFPDDGIYAGGSVGAPPSGLANNPPVAGVAVGESWCFFVPTSDGKIGILPMFSDWREVALPDDLLAGGLSATGWIEDSTPRFALFARGESGKIYECAWSETCANDPQCSVIGPSGFTVSSRRTALSATSQVVEGTPLVDVAVADTAGKIHGSRLETPESDWYTLSAPGDTLGELGSLHLDPGVDTPFNDPRVFFVGNVAEKTGYAFEWRPDDSRNYIDQTIGHTTVSTGPWTESALAEHDGLMALAATSSRLGGFQTSSKDTSWRTVSTR